MFCRWPAAGMWIVLLLAGAALSQGKLLPSTDHIYLQLEEERNITLLWNSSKPCVISLRTKLPLIATISPSAMMAEAGEDWGVQVTGHNLGYTRVIAAINVSNMFSVEERLIQVTVLQSNWLRILSVACGWIYFSVWTFSFYPQLLTNWRRKSVVGLNFDFLALNELGYVCYSIFNCCLYFISSIQEEYFRRHSGATNPVLLNDVLFSVHGFFATTATIVQVFFYERGGQSVSNTGSLLLTTGLCALTVSLLAAAASCVSWLDAVLWVSFIKLLVTMTKYIPQALMNYRNQSTEGWSIGCILCDLTGSGFSVLQMVLISINCDDWVSILGDPTKFGLGLVSIGFDLLFVVQHYVLYRSSTKKQEKDKKSLFAIINESSLWNFVWISKDTNR